MKECRRCKEIKPISEFFNQKKRADGKYPYCKSCCLQLRKEYVDRNKEFVYAVNMASKKRNRESWYAGLRRWREANPDKVKLIRDNANARRRSTVAGKLHDRMAGGIYKALRGFKNHIGWQQLVDYNTEQLQKHLQNTMPPGYTWKSFLDGELHVDHIIPVTAFNIESKDCIDFKRCWDLKNLRLLPASENCSKGSKLTQPFQPSLALAI